MIQAFDVRIYPNTSQRTQINKTIGCCRFLYNQMLAERNEVYEQLRDDKEALKAYKYKTEKQYKEEFPFLKEADSKALQNSNRNLFSALLNFFRGLKKKRKVGYPRFKSKRGKERYITNNINNNIQVDFVRKKLKLPKLGWVKYNDDRIFTQKITKVTVKKTKTGKYFVSLSLEAQDDVPLKETIHEEKITQFDMSAKELLVNDLIKMENPKFYRSVEKTLKTLQRRHSRTQKGSKNREKARFKVAKTHEKIYNRKKDWTHKLTRMLANSFDAVILEDLNIKGMQKFNSGLSKSVTLDFSWYQFTSYLKYKLEWLGKHFIQVDRFFASSKLCSCCGWKNNDLTLSERTWTCENCGTTHDRDVNASKNLRKEGLRILKEVKKITIIHDDKNTVGAMGIHASGDDVRPKVILRKIFRQLSAKEETLLVMRESPPFRVE
ncbi:MAG: RNA-guided endonuclease TnpB family protein [Promethearchaeota archaeon]